LARSSEKDKVEITHYILEHVPKEAEVTRIEYEGPMLSVYTKKPEILVEQSSVVAEIVGVFRPIPKSCNAARSDVTVPQSWATEARRNGCV
jgi:predicted metal-dependent RNase